MDVISDESSPPESRAEHSFPYQLNLMASSTLVYCTGALRANNQGTPCQARNEDAVCAQVHQCTASKQSGNAV